jgi:hypothetical protein
VTGRELTQLLELEGAKVEQVALADGVIAIDFRFKGTDDGSLRLEVVETAAAVTPWNPELGDFR